MSRDWFAGVLVALALCLGPLAATPATPHVHFGAHQDKGTVVRSLDEKDLISSDQDAASAE